MSSVTRLTAAIGNATNVAAAQFTPPAPTSPAVAAALTALGSSGEPKKAGKDGEADTKEGAKASEGGEFDEIDKARLALSRDLEQARDRASKHCELSSVRKVLLKKMEMDNSHFRELKQKTFDLLIELIEGDPIQSNTGDDVFNLVTVLSDCLQVPQNLVGTFKTQFIRAFGSSVEIFLLHSEKQHLHLVPKETKNKLNESLKNFKGLLGDTNIDSDIKFCAEVAEEAISRMVVPQTRFIDALAVLGTLFATAGDLYNAKFADALDKLKNEFKKINLKIEAEWFGVLFFTKNLVNQKLRGNSVSQVKTILCTLKMHGITFRWPFIYGCLELLHTIVSHSEDVNALTQALNGLGRATAPTPVGGPPLAATTSTFAEAQVMKAQSVCLVPGVLRYVDFKEYESNPLKHLKHDDKWADEAIRKKAEQICETIMGKLSDTYEGRSFLLEQYANHKATKNNSIWKKKLYDFLVKEMGTKGLEKDKDKTLWRIRRKPPAANPVATAADKQSMDDKVKKAFLDALASGDEFAVEKCLSDHLVLVNEPCPKSLLLMQRDRSRERHSYYGSCNNNLPLMSAAEYGHERIFRMLEWVGADSSKENEEGENVLHYLVRNKAMDRYLRRFAVQRKSLLDVKNRLGKTPVMCAIESGNETATNLLLDTRGVDLKQMDSRKWTLMHYAAWRGNTHLIKTLSQNAPQLVDAEAETSLFGISTTGGVTPLMLAAEQGDKEGCSALMAKTAAVKKVDRKGRTALCYVADSTILGDDKALEVAKILLMKDSTVLNLETSFGEVPLTLALKTKKIRTASHFLSENATLSHTDRLYGRNALHWAVLSDDWECILNIFKRDVTEKLGLASAKDKESKIPADLTSKNKIKSLLMSTTIAEINVIESVVKGRLRIKVKRFSNDGGSHQNE